MLRFVVRRILLLIPILLGLSILVFVWIRALPGSPAQALLGERATPDTIKQINHQYGLDKPVWEQFLLYVWNVLHFDFGLSYQYQGKTVVELIGGGWPYTATIGVLAFALIVPFGIGLGVIAALRQNSRVDYATMGFATFAASFPNFVIGALMIVFFAVLMYKWTGGEFFLPAGGWGVDDHLIMPAVTLALLPIAYTARLTRASWRARVVWNMASKTPAW